MDPRREPPGPTGASRADERTTTETDCGGFYTPRDTRNRRRLDRWMIAAALAYLAATAAVRWRASIPAAFLWLAVGFALVLALQATRAYREFLRAADELLRKTLTEALALGFAAGVLFALAWPLLEGLGAPPLDSAATAVVMLLASAAGWWIGVRRYGRGGG